MAASFVDYYNNERPALRCNTKAQFNSELNWALDSFLSCLDDPEQRQRRTDQIDGRLHPGRGKSQEDVTQYAEDRRGRAAEEACP